MKNNIRNNVKDDHDKEFEGNIMIEKHGKTQLSLNRSVKILISISWLCAGLAAFTSPNFAFPGILLGVISNRITHGSGNAAIVTNVALAAINLLFSFIMVLYMKNIINSY